MYDFLSLLWRGGAFACWWTSPNRQSFWFAADDLSAADRIFPKSGQQDVYLSVHPLVKVPPTNSRGEIAQPQYVRSQTEFIASINCVYGEFDNIDQIDCETQPTVTISSGGGLHCYWLFDEPFIITTDEDRHYAKHLQYAWVDHVGSDESAKDLARVLRVPGTYNYKEKYSPDFPAVEIIDCDLDRLYNIAEFEIQETPPMPTAKAMPENISINGGWFHTATHACLNDIANAKESQRNNTLNQRAFRIGQFVPHGISEEDALALAIDAASYCGLENGEAEATARGAIIAGMKSPDYGPQDEDLKGPQDDIVNGVQDTPTSDDYNMIDYTPEDGGVLDIWLSLHEEQWLYVTGHDGWYAWTGTHWQRDYRHDIESTIQSLLRDLHVYAIEQADFCKRMEDKSGEASYKKWIIATKRTSARVSSIENMARSHLATEGGNLNRGNVLNLRNGVLCLDSYEFSGHDRSHHFTYCLPYDYDVTAECPLYERFLNDVLVDDDGKTDLNLMSLWQELIGYALTNETGHEVMIWLSGEGSNGKSVALNILQAMLGDLSRTIDFHQIGQPGNYDMAEVAGRRVILSTEAEKNGRLKEGTIRRIVSGETLSSRPIYGSPLEFKPVAKIWWAMNDKPRLNDTSNAMWRRLKLLPFNRVFSEDEKDTRLTERLLEELPGILNFALRGLMRLRKNGKFSQSQSVASALLEYRQESNHVGQWVSENLTLTESPTTLASSLMDDYTRWCLSNNRKPYNSTNLGKELKRLVAHKRTSIGIAYAAQTLEGGI